MKCPPDAQNSVAIQNRLAILKEAVEMILNYMPAHRLFVRLHEHYLIKANKMKCGVNVKNQRVSRNNSTQEAFPFHFAKSFVDLKVCKHQGVLLRLSWEHALKIHPRA